MNTSTDELTETEARMLDFEAGQSHWKFAGSKDSLIRDFFDISPTVYYKRLALLIRRDAAIRYDVHTVRRLQRVHEARADQRSAGARGVGF